VGSATISKNQHYSDNTDWQKWIEEKAFHSIYQE
jgi:hypothetical protein